MCEGEKCKESMILRDAITENIKQFITLLLKLRYTIFNILQCATKVPKMWLMIKKTNIIYTVLYLFRKNTTFYILLQLYSCDIQLNQFIFHIENKLFAFSI